MKTVYGKVKSCLGADFRKQVTRDAQDSGNYTKYENCVSKDSNSDNCLKCRKKGLSSDSDSIY